MRIVFLTTKLNFLTSGASVEELDLKVRRFMELGHRVLVVTMFSTANNITEDPPYPLAFEQWSGSQLTTQWGAYRMLKKYEREADVFYIDGQVFLYGAGLYRLLGGQRPILAHFNRELIAWPELVSSLFGIPKKGILRRGKEFLRYWVEWIFGIPLANYIDAATFTNPHLQQTYRDFGFNPTISFANGDAFDYRRFMERYGVTQETYRARNKNSGPYTIYYSSRMAPGKGFDVLVAAFGKLKDKESYRLVLGGKGPEDEKINKLVQELGIERYVSYTGWAPKPEHYARLRDVCDIFVQPSQSGMDKTSYILLEAMAMGVPSVLPKGGGLEWDAKESALYFTGGDVDDLARTIEALGANRELRAHLSANCYARLKEDEMEYHAQVARLESTMRQLLETK